MKSAATIAIIAMALQVLASLYYLLLNYEVLKFDSSFQKVIQPFFLLSEIGLLIFFIIFYEKQPKN